MSIIFITGGTGFIGSHVISQLLEKGYRVRAAARSSAKQRSIFPDAPTSQLEVVEIPTLTSDYSEVLKGVDAVIHVASPLFSKGASSEEIFYGAYEGTLHIVHQSIAAGIKKIIITGTFAGLFDSKLQFAFGTAVISEKDYNPATIESFNHDQAPPTIYMEAKAAADKKVWELAKEHPDVDFTILLPPAVFGPLVPNFPFSSSSKPADSIGTNAGVASIITSGDKYPVYYLGHVADVRDVARAHVAALSAPSVPGRDKRFIISRGTFTLKDIADLIRRERPELAHRLPKEDAVPPKQTNAPLDTSFAAEVLGLKEYIPWEESALGAIDAQLAWEKRRAANL